MSQRPVAFKKSPGVFAEAAGASRMRKSCVKECALATSRQGLQVQLSSETLVFPSSENVHGATTGFHFLGDLRCFGSINFISLYAQQWRQDRVNTIWRETRGHVKKWLRKPLEDLFIIDRYDPPVELPYIEAIYIRVPASCWDKQQGKSHGLRAYFKGIWLVALGRLDKKGP